MGLNFKMRYGQIRKYDVANGPGIRTSVFFTGCPFKCKGCFNEKYQSFSSGNLWTESEENKLFEYLSSKHISGLSVLGGEPLVQGNELRNLLKRVKEKTGKSVWLWSGFEFEQLDSNQLKILEYVDVLVDGLFVVEKKDLKLKFRGSSNQRVIDLKKTRDCGKIVIWNGIKSNQ